MPHEASLPRSRCAAAPYHVLLGLLLVATAARLLAAVLVGGDEFRFADEAIYMDAAAGSRGLLAVPAAPGYPAFLTLVGLVVPDGVLPVRAGQAFVAALGVLLCYGLGRRLGGEAAGVASAALYSVDPLLVVSAALLYPEAPGALLLTGSVLAAWDAVRRDRLLLAGLAGLQLGAFTLFRPLGLAIAPAMIAWVGLAPARGWPRRGAHLGLLVGAWLLVLLPWLHGNYRDSGRLLPMAAAVRTVPGIGAQAERYGVGRAVVQAAVRDPMVMVRRTLREFAHFWELYPTRLVTDDASERSDLSRNDPRLSAAPLVQRSLRDVASALSFGVELALAAVGLVAGWRARRRETLWLLAGVLSFALGYALFYGKLRYRIPALPIVLGFAGLGAVTLVSRFRGDHARGRPESAEASSQQ